MAVAFHELWSSRGSVLDELRVLQAAADDAREDEAFAAASLLRFDDRTVRPTSRALCEMAKAREAWSRKNWTGSRRCSSRQGGRGRGPRTPAYSCGRERWRYCIA